MQPAFVRGIGLETGGQAADPMQLLLKEALNYVVFIPWSTGTMFFFEKELYHDELPPDRWNARWWELAQRYQGIVPPAQRGEEFCDAATKTHINDDPAGYYDYALSFVLLFQLHQHIATEILHQDPHDTNYFGRREVGEFLASIMTPGSSVDWRSCTQDRFGPVGQAHARLLRAALRLVEAAQRGAHLHALGTVVEAHRGSRRVGPSFACERAVAGAGCRRVRAGVRGRIRQEHRWHRLLPVLGDGCWPSSSARSATSTIPARTSASVGSTSKRRRPRPADAAPAPKEPAGWRRRTCARRSTTRRRSCTRCSGSR